MYLKFLGMSEARLGHVKGILDPTWTLGGRRDDPPPN